jgi:hypothetical protein
MKSSTISRHEPPWWEAKIQARRGDEEDIICINLISLSCWLTCLAPFINRARFTLPASVAWKTVHDALNAKIASLLVIIFRMIKFMSSAVGRDEEVFDSYHGRGMSGFTTLVALSSADNGLANESSHAREMNPSEIKFKLNFP